MMKASEMKELTEQVETLLAEEFHNNILPGIEELLLKAAKQGEYSVTITLKQENLYRATRVLKSFGYIVREDGEFSSALIVCWR